MRTNNLLTFILYALILGLICVAGWKACKVKEEKALKAKEMSEMDQTLRELGYTELDSTGSSYNEKHSTDGTYKDGSAEGDTKTAVAPPSTSTKTAADGIEGDEETVKPTTSSTPSKKAPLVAKTEDEEPPKSSSSRESDLDNERSDTPKYMVVTGTFKYLANAREQMETLVKQGFEDAEVGKFNKGRYACAIAKRTNSLSEAKNLAARLKKKGYKDAIVKVRK